MADKDTAFGKGNFSTKTAETLESFGSALIPSKISNKMSFLDARAEEVLQQREATFLARSHRNMAIKSVGGGVSPEFDNGNLYGFALMTFSGGFDSGWNVFDIKSVLKPPTTATLTGGDEVANTSSYFFNVNPKSISVSEPNAVHIVPTQNNGFYVESQGIVLRRLSISGTTGFRPAASMLSEDYKLPKSDDEPTGFLNHIKLRNLFRNYSNLKKDAAQAKNTYMVWYNGRTQEAWFCEPESFSSARDASSPFVSRYEIGATLLHKVAFSAVATKLSPGLMGTQFYLESVRLAAVLLNRQNLPKQLQTINNMHADITAGLNFISEGTQIIEKYCSTVVNGLGVLAGAGPAMVVPILAEVKNIGFSLKSIINNGAIFKSSLADMDLGGPDVGTGALQSMWLDYGSSLQSVFTSLIHATNSLLMNEDMYPKETALGNLARNNSFYTRNGGVGNAGGGHADYSYIEAIVPKSVDDLVTIMGNNGAPRPALPLLETANKLQYPYLSAVPSGNTLKPGDTIYIPYPNGKKIPPNIETKLFPLNIKLGLFQELLGRDIRLVSLVTGTGQKSFDLSINSNGDLDLIESGDNMVQAIYIKLNVERGELGLHPGFGFINVVGMKSTLNLSFAANLAINDTMLSDGRIESISGLKIEVSGDIMHVYLNAHIIGNDSSVPVTFSMGV